MPTTGKRGAELEVIPGHVPPLSGEFQGCRFADRCDHAFDRCHAEAPDWTEVAEGHRVRCHLRATERAGPIASALAPAVMRMDAGGRPRALLEVRDLKVHFPIRRGVLKRTVGHVRAVDGVSLAIAPGRTLALVGESGCGKTTAGKSILQLLRPTAGEVTFDGVELTHLRGDALRRRRADFQIVFQDPYASLNPRLRVHDILMEGMSCARSARLPRRARAAHRRAAGPGRAGVGGGVQLSARVLGRAATADRDRARAQR